MKVENGLFLCTFLDKENKWIWIWVRFMTVTQFSYLFCTRTVKSTYAHICPCKRFLFPYLLNESHSEQLFLQEIMNELINIHLQFYFGKTVDIWKKYRFCLFVCFWFYKLKISLRILAILYIYSFQLISYMMNKAENVSRYFY